MKTLMVFTSFHIIGVVGTGETLLVLTKYILANFAAHNLCKQWLGRGNSPLLAKQKKDKLAKQPPFSQTYQFLQTFSGFSAARSCLFHVSRVFFCVKFLCLERVSGKLWCLFFHRFFVWSVHHGSDNYESFSGDGCVGARFRA